MAFDYRAYYKFQAFSANLSLPFTLGPHNYTKHTFWIIMRDCFWGGITPPLLNTFVKAYWMGGVSIISGTH